MWAGNKVIMKQFNKINNETNDFSPRRTIFAADVSFRVYCSPRIKLEYDSRIVFAGYLISGLIDCLNESLTLRFACIERSLCCFNVLGEVIGANDCHQ